MPIPNARHQKRSWFDRFVQAAARTVILLIHAGRRNVRPVSREGYRPPLQCAVLVLGNTRLGLDHAVTVADTALAMDYSVGL